MSRCLNCLAPLTVFDLIRSTWTLGPKPKKNKKKKGDKSKLNRDPEKNTDFKIDRENGNDEIEAEGRDPKTLSEIAKPFNEIEAPIKCSTANNAIPSTNGISLVSGSSIPPEADAEIPGEIHNVLDDNAQTPPVLEASIPVQLPQDNSLKSSDINTGDRLDALARERSALREEVAQLRRSLEEIQEKHEQDLFSVREQLKETQGEKEHAETQYRNLLGKVNTIRSQLGDRLKADAVSLRLYPSSCQAYIETGRSVASEDSNRGTRGAMWESTRAKRGSCFRTGQNGGRGRAAIQGAIKSPQSNYAVSTELVQRERRPCSTRDSGQGRIYSSQAGDARMGGPRKGRTLSSREHYGEGYGFGRTIVKSTRSPRKSGFRTRYPVIDCRRTPESTTRNSGWLVFKVLHIITWN